jgi:hypothetical protein
MSTTTFEVAAGSPNVLTVPREARDYISERSESRSFNLDSFSIDRFEPHEVIIRLGIVQKGAEQLEPFTVTVVLGEPAPRQLTEGLTAALDLSPTT